MWLRSKKPELAFRPQKDMDTLFVWFRRVIMDTVEWKSGSTAKPYKMILQWNLTQKRMRACGACRQSNPCSQMSLWHSLH